MHFINAIKTETESFSPELAKTLLNPLHTYNSEMINYFSYPKYTSYISPNYLKSTEYFDPDSFVDFDPGNNEVPVASASYQNFQDYFSYQRGHSRHEFSEGERKCLSYNNGNLQANLGQMWSFQNEAGCLLHVDSHESSKEVCFDDTLDINGSHYSDDSTGKYIM